MTPPLSFRISVRLWWKIQEIKNWINARIFGERLACFISIERLTGQMVMRQDDPWLWKLRWLFLTGRWKSRVRTWLKARKASA